MFNKQKKIPNGWVGLKLIEVANFLDFKRIPLSSLQRNQRKGKYPYYGASGIIDHIDDYIFDEDLVLLGEDGANILDRSSRLAFIARGKYWVNNHAHVLQPKKNILLYLLSEYLESLNYQKYNTGSAQPKLNRKVCESIRLILPPLPEQKKIVEVLQTWDSYLEKLDQKIKIKKQIKKGLMQRLLTGDVRLKGFGGEWREVELRDISTINPNGNNLPQEFIYIDLESVEKGCLKKEKLIKLENAPSRAQRLLSKGDILFQMVRPYQRNNYFFNKKGNYVASTGYAQLKAIDSETFLYQLIHADFFVNAVLTRCTGSNYPAINSLDLSKIKFKVPKKKEQTTIAHILTTADQEIDTLEKKRAIIAQQKKYLLNQLITGELRLPEFRSKKIS